MKILYLAVGTLFLVIGAIGAVLPLLPTTPFLLVTAFCFARGSERFHRWFTGTRLYKKHLESYVTGRAMTLKTKCSILSLATAMLLLAFFLVNHTHARICIVAVLLLHYWYFLFRIKTSKPAGQAGHAADHRDPRP